MFEDFDPRDFCPRCHAPATVEDESIESSASSGYSDAWHVYYLTCGHEMSFKVA